MIQENKEILIKDLCARLTYGVKVLFENEVLSIDYISAVYEEIKLDIPDNFTLDISNVKPYLFPLSSMTREQLFDVQEIIGKNEIEIEDGFLHIINSDRNTITYLEILAVFEWFYKNHFDIYGLIPMGHAIDATNLNIY